MERKIGAYLGTFQRRYGVKRALEIIKEIGYDAVEISLSSYQSKLPDELWRFPKMPNVYKLGESAVREYFSEIKAYADSLGVEIYEAYGRADGIFLEPELDEGVYFDARLDCIAARALGAKYCVMSPVSNRILPNTYDEDLRKYNFEFFNKIIPYACENGVKVAMDTVGSFGAAYHKTCLFGRLDEFIRSYEQIASAGNNQESFCVCADTGRINMTTRWGEPSVADWLRELRGAVECLHLNDNDSVSDLRAIPCINFGSATGVIDWREVMRALDEIGYGGVYNLELDFNLYGQNMSIEEASFALKVMKRLFEMHDEK